MPGFNGQLLMAQILLILHRRFVTQRRGACAADCKRSRCIRRSPAAPGRSCGNHADGSVPFSTWRLNFPPASATTASKPMRAPVTRTGAEDTLTGIVANPERSRQVMGSLRGFGLVVTRRNPSDRVNRHSIGPVVKPTIQGDAGYGNRVGGVVAVVGVRATREHQRAKQDSKMDINPVHGISRYPCNRYRLATDLCRSLHKSFRLSNQEQFPPLCDWTGL